MSAGPLPQRKAIEIALQIASGLAAAHEKGILHRDLKPENLFLTRDGRLKILDFGLAKLSEPESPTHSAATAAASGTEAGTVLGTMGYMSPEQVRGQAVDARTDIFSFGAVLYEMLSGKRAFHGATSADTISAILREDPPDLAETNRSISPALDRIVRHCLEKNPEQRFHSARDLAFDLESLSGTSTNAASKPAYKPRRIPRFAIVAGLAVIAVIAAFLIGRYVVSGPASAAPEIHQLTFRRGNVHGAAFAPDGHTVVYAAEWEGSADEIFTTSEQGPDSRSLDLKDADLLAISSSGQMAIKVRPRLAGTFARPGTLATVPLTGGAPRELLDNVEDADFSPDGSQMAVILHPPGEQFLLQYPIGHTLLTEPYWLSHARVSPDGKSVAFASHPFGGDEGSVILADESGKVHELDKGFLTLQGLAWNSTTNEIWFTATRVGGNRALYAVSLSGKERLITRVPGALTLKDISHEGRVLMVHSYQRFAAMATPPGGKQERDLSWLDSSIPRAISRDGKIILLSEVGEGGGAVYSVYLRPTDGGPAVRLADGFGCDLSPDGKTIFAYLLGNPSKVFLVPTLGAPRELQVPGGVVPGCGRFLPDGRQIVFYGFEPGHKPRKYVYDLDGHAAPRPITPEGVGSPLLQVAIPNGGKFDVDQDESGQFFMYPLAGGTPAPVHGLQPGESVVGIAADNRTVFAGLREQVPMKIYAVDSVTGQRKLWKLFGPLDPTGERSFLEGQVTGEHDPYVYGYEVSYSELYLMDGLK